MDKRGIRWSSGAPEFNYVNPNRSYLSHVYMYVYVFESFVIDMKFIVYYELLVNLYVNYFVMFSITHPINIHYHTYLKVCFQSSNRTIAAFVGL